MSSDAKDPALQSNWSDRRRSLRMNSRVPVLVEWEDAPGQPMSEEARTRVINFSGCLICLSLDLPLEQKVRVTNLANRAAAEAIVVWKGSETVEGLEHGLELQNPHFEFWGLEM